MTKVLLIQSSANGEKSLTTPLAADLAKKLGDVTTRDVSTGFPFMTAEWIANRHVKPEEANAEQAELLALSNRLIEEIQAADILVIGSPVYNFNISAALKSWIDMLARPGLTFQYTANGPEGLIKGKKAYVVSTSGGTPAGADFDYATRYLQFILGFMGITDVTVIGTNPAEARAAIDAI